MNRFSIALVLFTSIGNLAFSQNERLKKLQETYQKEIIRATAPVTSQYKSALVKLQQNYINANMLEEALKVKKEIESLDINPIPSPLADSVAVPASTGPAATASMDSGRTEWNHREWKGDLKVVMEDGEPVLEMEGTERGTRLFSMPLNAEDYPSGFNVIYRYKSAGFNGDGVETRAMRDDRSFTFRNPTLIFDGEWHEYTWPFSDYRGSREIIMQFLLENGTGTIYFKDITFSPL